MFASLQVEPADFPSAGARFGRLVRLFPTGPSRSPMLKTRRQLFFISCLERFACSIVLALAWLNLSAAEGATKSFDIPAGTAPDTLKQFSAQAGGHLLYAAEVVEGVRTNAVKGKLTAREVIDRMLTGTRLAVKQDEKTGAMAIMLVAPNEQKESPGSAADSQSPSTKKKQSQP